MDPAILLIIVFIVAPLIERLLKAGKGAEQPPDQPPQQRIPQQRPQQRVPDAPMQHRREEPASAGADDEAAAAMLPDDLWEILTGERRSPALSVPEEEPEEPGPAYEAGEYGEDTRSADELASLEGRLPAEWTSGRPEGTRVVPHDAYVRPLPEREPPRVVSLEDLEFDPEKRHDRFHDRLETLGGPARVRRQKPSSYRFTSDEDLRRAIVMKEILGTPKGLE